MTLDIHDHLDPVDQAYFRETREKRLGGTLEEIQGYPLPAKKRCRLPFRLPDLQSPGHPASFLEKRRFDLRIDLAKHLGRHHASAENAPGSGDERSAGLPGEGRAKGVAKRRVLPERGADQLLVFDSGDHNR